MARRVGPKTIEESEKTVSAYLTDVITDSQSRIWVFNWRNQCRSADFGDTRVIIQHDDTVVVQEYITSKVTQTINEQGNAHTGPHNKISFFGVDGVTFLTIENIKESTWECSSHRVFREYKQSPAIDPSLQGIYEAEISEIRWTKSSHVVRTC